MSPYNRLSPWRLSTWPVVALLVVGGCADRKCRGIEPNGPDLTGTAMTWQPASGCTPIADIQLRGVNLQQGVTLTASREPVTDVKLVEGALKAGSHAPRDFIGATLIGAAENGEPVLLRIDDIAVAEGTRDAGQPTQPSGVLLYRLSYRWRSQQEQPAPNSDGWAPLCKDNGQAIAVAGQWDFAVGKGHGGKQSAADTEVTFACQGSAIAKCVTVMGYRPWAQAAGGGPPLDALHQACVRAVRADYCGNGQSNTRKDEHINFYDSAGVQHDGAEWPREAEWTATGARCVMTTRLDVVPADPRTRRPETRVQDYLQKTCPEVLKPCTGTPKDPGPAILFTEAAPALR